MISDRATRSTRARPAPRTHWRGIVPALFLIAALLAIPASAQTIEGQLLDGATRQPVPVGVVSLLAEEGRVVERVEADSAGRFRIDAPDAGSYFLRAERIGYRTVTDGIFDLGRDGRLEVEIWMRASPVELEGVEANVEARTMYEERLDRMLRNQGFYDRQTRTSGWFITPEDIEERPPTRPRDLFRMIPGIETGNVTGTPGTAGDGNSQPTSTECGSFRVRSGTWSSTSTCPISRPWRSIRVSLRFRSSTTRSASVA